MNIQDAFLNRARQDRVPVTVFLTNGFRGFDGYIVMVESDGKQQMIYKHAISTIAPARPVNWSQEAAQ